MIGLSRWFKLKTQYGVCLEKSKSIKNRVLFSFQKGLGLYVYIRFIKPKFSMSCLRRIKMQPITFNWESELSLLFVHEHVILSSYACGDRNHDLSPTFSSMSWEWRQYHSCDNFGSWLSYIQWVKILYNFGSWMT